jgi:hypothetical protein
LRFGSFDEQGAGGRLDREESVVTLPMRHLAALLAAVCWAGTAAGEPATIWYNEQAERPAADKSMSVYPAALAGQPRRAAIDSMQPESDAMIPPSGFDLPDESAMPDSNRPGESAAPRPLQPPAQSAQLGTVPPEAYDDRSEPRGSAPEELPPSVDMYDEGDFSLTPDPIPVSPWGGEAPAPVWSSGEWFRSGIWYTNADFLIVRRDRPRDRLLIGIDVTNPDNLFFNYGGSGGVEPAMRVTVGRFIGRDWQNRDHSVELSFLGINEFRTGQSIRGQEEGGLILLLDQKQGGVNNADLWFTEHASRFHTIEADLRLRHRPDKDRLVMAPDGTWTRQYTSSYVPSMLFGMRYVNLNEDYNFFSRSLGVLQRPSNGPDPVFTPITETEFRGDYDIETRNDLFGVQIGGDLINQHEEWYWGVRGKAAALINFAEQFTVAQFNDLRAQREGNPGDPSIDIAPRVEHATRANEAFFAELSLMTAYHFTPNFTARASYDFMWLAGVALAPDQFTFTERNRLSLDGVVFYQGLSLGLEMVW